MSYIVLAPFWVHLAALVISAAVLLAARPEGLPRASAAIVRGIVYCALFQVLLACAALFITYWDSRAYEGCQIGLAGYAVNGLALFAVACLLCFIFIRAKHYGKRATLRLSGFLLAEALLTTAALLVHVRSLSHCMADV